MTTRIVDSSGGEKGGRRERTGVFALAGLISTVVALYLAINMTTGGNE